MRIPTKPSSRLALSHFAQSHLGCHREALAVLSRQGMDACTFQYGAIRGVCRML